MKKRSFFEVFVSLESSTHHLTAVALFESNLMRTTRPKPQWKSNLQTSTLPGRTMAQKIVASDFFSNSRDFSLVCFVTAFTFANLPLFSIFAFLAGFLFFFCLFLLCDLLFHLALCVCVCVCWSNKPRSRKTNKTGRNRTIRQTQARNKRKKERKERIGKESSVFSSCKVACDVLLC